MKYKLQGYLLDQEHEYFEQYRMKNGLTASAAINQIVSEHMDIEFLKTELKNRDYNSKLYKEIMTMKEIINTYLYAEEQNAVFIPTSVTKHPIISKAEDEVRKNIGKSKQRKDYRRKG